MSLKVTIETVELLVKDFKKFTYLWYLLYENFENLRPWKKFTTCLDFTKNHLWDDFEPLTNLKMELSRLLIFFHEEKTPFF